MDDKFDMEYLNSLSLFDLYEMANFYDLLLNADWDNWYSPGCDIPEFDRGLCYDRSKLLELAIRMKKCSMDEKLFRSPIVKNVAAFVGNKNQRMK